MRKSSNRLYHSLKFLIAFVILFLAISQTGISQHFWNTDFEYAGYGSQPRKWSIEGEGAFYSAKLDSTIKKSGNKSLHLSLTNAEVYTILSVPAELIAGKTLRAEGYIQHDNADSLQTMLIFHNPAEGTTDSGQSGKQDGDKWELISLEASIPQNYSSDRLLIALVVNGTGQFWFDDVRITIDGRECGNGEPDFREPTPGEIEMLNKRAVPIQITEAQAGSNNFKPLSDMIGNSRIVALGENSHGSSSIFRLKHRLVRYLVKHEGFTIFALEMPAVEADYINEYVLHGKGTIDDVLDWLTYPSWQTREIIDLIEWIKAYNEHNDVNLQFRGFDMQNGRPALEALEKFVQLYDDGLSAELAELKELYNHASKDGAPWEAVYRKSEEVFNQLQSKDYTGVEADEAATAKHYMDIFMQSLSFQYRTGAAKSRDAYLAENIAWILEHSSDGSKMIISADNTHVTEADGKMGAYLEDRYGEDYMTFGFTYNRGTYSAYGPEPFYKVHPSYVGTYEYFFSKSEYKNFILDLRDGKDIPILNETAGFRTIGSRPQEVTQFIEINLRKHFDIIVYLERSKHTTPLTN